MLRAPLPHLAGIGAQSLVLWLLIALGFHLNNVAFGIDLPFHATFLLIAFLVVGVAIPTPGMVGGFHAFYLIALSRGVRGHRASARRRRASPPTRSRTCRCSSSGSPSSAARGSAWGGWRSSPARARRRRSKARRSQEVRP